MVGYLGHDPELSMDTIQNNVLFGSSQDVLPRLNAVVLTDEVLAMENGADHGRRQQRRTAFPAVRRSGWRWRERLPIRAH